MNSAKKPEAMRRLLHPPNDPVDLAKMIGAGIDICLAPLYFWFEFALAYSGSPDTRTTL